MTFAGVLHHFQGERQAILNGLKQFYYIHPCKGYNHNDLPYHLIGQHLSMNDRVSSIDYLVLELFDDDGEQYNVFLSSTLRSYANTDETDYDALTAHTNELVSSDETLIGNRFKLIYDKDGEKTVHVTLYVDDECPLEFTIIRQAIFNAQLNRYQMHYVRVNPPKCFKCAICGLLGTFRDQRMETCHGEFIEEFGEWKSVYDPRGWTWEVTYTNEYCPVLDTTTTLPPDATPRPSREPYVPPPEPSFPDDPCDDETSTKYTTAEGKCIDGRNRGDVSSCCTQS